jgi:lipopolysaccharide/colanic/teichoic acid biosynthesis glycosyltransferase
MSRPPFLLQLLDLALILGGFAAALFLYASLFPAELSLLTPGELPEGLAASVFAVWISAQVQRHGGADDAWQFFLEQLCLGAGLNLIVQALLAYVFVFSLPTTVTMTGCLFAALLLTLSKAWVHQRLGKSGMLLVGYDSVTRDILSAFPLPLLGFIGARDCDAPAGAPWLGDVRQLAEVVESRRPTHIVIGLKDWAARLSPTLLMQYRQDGIVVDDSPDLYERLLRRVCSDRLDPADLLLSPALQADSRAMALQAIYTNLIGLFFLLALSPLMALIALAVVFSGRGPIFETVPCLGFQKIPFLLLRFRTRRMDGRGSPTRIGGLISRLHLVNLPQLVNVVRGEMALFGPRPVRHEFATRLTQLMPFYSHRFSVKPGILGWAQMHLRRGTVVPREGQQIEYDLYYVKEGSPLLDCEIFLRTLLGGTRPRKA